MKMTFTKNIANMSRNGLKSAILSELKNCQNDTFEPLHEIQKFFLAKSFLLKRYESGNKKKLCIMSQGPPNLGFMQEKVQKGDFLKKPSRKLIFLFCFRFE